MTGVTEVHGSSDQATKEGNRISPYQELFRKCVTDAYKAKASDVHIEPTLDGVTIRFRVFGDMQPPWMTLGCDHRNGMMLAIKRETGLSVGVAGRPQDSRCQVEGVTADLRVNLLPTIYGEKIVLRILDSTKEFDLKASGLSTTTISLLSEACRQKNGVIIVSGPTGSGKTTTLYSLLKSLDKARLNIVTLEDPVEYTVSGINQVRVTSKVSFAGALRAVLRQDPDVILLGEIRDEETADLAFKAAATGHLVLSTLHANSALQVVGRLLGLGVLKETIRDNLRFSLAQILCQRLCPACKVIVPPSAQDQTPVANRNIKGCPSCLSGIAGMIPAAECADSEGIGRYLGSMDKETTEKDFLRISFQESLIGLVKGGLIEGRKEYEHDF